MVLEWGFLDIEDSGTAVMCQIAAFA